jgi:signal transduction histidine kinase
VAQRYRLILDLARSVTAQRDLPRVLDATFAALRTLLDFGGGSIALVDDEGWISFAATDPPATAEAMSMRIRVGEGVSGTIARTGEPVYIADIRTDAEVTEERKQKSVSQGVVAYFGVPLVTEGRSIGVLQIDSPTADAWDEEDRLLLLSFTPIVAAAVQNARLHAREQAALERMEELDQRHRDFVAMVSHELRTPLTALMGYSETILSYHEALGPEGVLGLVERTKGAANRLAGMVEELLDISVIQRGELRLELAPVDVRALVAEVASQYVPPDHTVAVHVADDVPEVVTDASRLAQLLGNLLANAAKFSPEGSEVEVTAGVAGDDLEIVVRDHGPGIPEEQRERVFERFVQLEPAKTRSKGGFGLGLYIVRQVATALGGSIEVQGKAGDGAELVARIPLRPGLGVAARG